MKSTFSRLPLVWVKMTPVFLLLFTVGIANVQAQNYKPLDEAMTSVRSALKSLEQVPKSEGNSKVSAAGSGSSTGTVKPGGSPDISVRAAYYNEFLRLAGSLGSVSQAVAQLDERYNPQTLSEPRRSRVIANRILLIQLITQ